MSLYFNILNDRFLSEETPSDEPFSDKDEPVEDILQMNRLQQPGHCQNSGKAYQLTQTQKRLRIN